MFRLLRNQIISNITNHKNNISTKINSFNIYSNNSNISSSNNNLINNINKSYTSSTSTSTNNSNNILKLNGSHFEKLQYIKFNKPLPEDIIEIQKEILKINPTQHQLSIHEKLNYANYLHCIEEKSKSFQKYDKDILDRVWSFLDLAGMDINGSFNEEIIRLKSIMTIIGLQIGVAFGSKTLLPRARETIHQYIDTLKKIEKIEGSTKTVENYAPYSHVLLLSASHIGMWKEMVYLHSKVKPNILKDQSDQFAHVFNYHAIYKMITNDDPLLKYANPLFDTSASSKQISESEFIKYRVYDTLEEGFQKFKKSAIGQLPLDISNSFTSRVVKEYDDFEKKGRNRNGYIISYAPSSFTFLGTAVSMDIQHYILGGIVSQDFKRIQLYLPFNDLPSNPDNVIEYQYDLNIINSSDINNTINLGGTCKIIETFKNNSKIILEAGVQLTLKRRQLLYEQ